MSIDRCQVTSFILLLLVYGTGQTAADVASPGPEAQALSRQDTGRKASGREFWVVDYGAKGDGLQLETTALQSAIDDCAGRGGGTVIVPKGDYPTGGLVLKDNVILRLSAGARVLGTGQPQDYRKHGCLIYASEAKNIGLSGPGIIDGRGAGVRQNRYLIACFRNCRQISLTGVTLKDSAAWGVHLVECDQVQVDGLRIDSVVNANNDGLDLDGCQNVFISNCRFRCGDDAIALKTNRGVPCKNIAIANCVLSSRWAAFRFGPESRGNFENIAVSNCTIEDTFGCGIKLQMAEGAQMKNILFANLVMDNVTGPISLRLGNWVSGILARDGNAGRSIGTFQDVRFSNIRARVAANAQTERYSSTVFNAGTPFPGEEKSCISITGLPGHPITGISLSDIHITFPGGGTAAEAARREVPDLQDTYPEYFMFGVLPAYGLYAHHVKGLVLNHVRFDLAAPDLRPAIVTDDAEDLTLADCHAQGDRSAGCLVRLQQTRQAFVHGLRALNEVGTLVRVEGRDAQAIGLIGNDGRRADRLVELGDGVDKAKIDLDANLGRH
jgi:hypothetical protein